MSCRVLLVVASLACWVWFVVRESELGGEWVSESDVSRGVRLTSHAIRFGAVGNFRRIEPINRHRQIQPLGTPLIGSYYFWFVVVWGWRIGPNDFNGTLQPKEWEEFPRWSILHTPTNNFNCCQSDHFRPTIMSDHTKQHKSHTSITINNLLKLMSQTVMASISWLMRYAAWHRTTFRDTIDTPNGI